jgi:hypothetical protein
VEFSDLEALRRLLEGLARDHERSLSEYWSEEHKGFRHELNSEPKFSVSSTATCVMSLIAAGRFKERCKYADELVRGFLSCDWQSASLPRLNEFTTAFILEAVTLLQENGAQPVKEQELQEAEEALRKALSDENEPGAVKLSNSEYPPSAYLTQLALRTLRRRGKLDEEKKDSRRWAFNEITRQVTLKISGDRTADMPSLAYAAIILSSTSRRNLSSSSDLLTPEESRILKAAIDTLFDAQNKKDASWPLSRPIFLYPKYGNAYCYEYEMLTQLLQEENLQPYLLEHLDGLDAAAKALESSYYPLKGGVADGHRGTILCLKDPNPGPLPQSTISLTSLDDSSRKPSGGNYLKIWIKNIHRHHHFEPIKSLPGTFWTARFKRSGERRGPCGIRSWTVLWPH